MIEQDVARLWQRAAASRTAQWDAAAARAELRELGLNPNAPPPEAEIRASLEGGAADGESVDSGAPGRARGDDDAPRDDLSPSFVTPAEAGAHERMSAARENSCALGPRLRGDDEWGGRDDESGHSSDESEPAEVPTPIRPGRHNEWTRARMAAFLRELAACQNVSQAAKSVGMGRQSAYKLRNRLPGTPFALAWEVALETGLQQLAHAVMERALNGEEIPVYYHGELVGTRRKYDNRLAAWLLDNPWKLGRKQVAREFAAEDWDFLLDQVEFGSDHEFAPTPEEQAELEALMTPEERENLADPLARTAASSWYMQHPPAPPRRIGS